MRIFVSAAEISSDLQAEKIIRSFLELNLHPGVEIFGIGGPRLRSIPGFRSLARAEEMRVMGFTEVLSKLSQLRVLRARIESELDRTPPDVILTFDYPDFHFSLMKRLEARPWFESALRICGIPPKVWVWRRGRVETIRRLYDGVWVIFPFERDFYENLGIPVIYEGNPLIAEILGRAERNFAPEADGVVRLAVLPGSRDAELSHHLPLIEPTLHHLSLLLGKTVAAEVPVPKGVDRRILESALVSSDRVVYRFTKDDSRAVLLRNRLGLIKSGTATLEAAVLGCVPVIFYKMSPISEWIFFTLVRYLGPVGLPNILLGVKQRKDNVFPELIAGDARPARLATELFRLMEDPARIEELRLKGAELRSGLAPHLNVPREIARKIESWIRHAPKRPIQRNSTFWVRAGSFLWSSLNWVRRRIPFRRLEKLPLPSVMVGNLQVGGSGKTPLVIALAREAISRGYRPGVVSRGYGGSYPENVRLVERPEPSSVIGDEPLEMIQAVPGLKLALSSDRRLGARELERAGVNFIIADDGFQNLGFDTDVRILMVTDAGRGEVLYRDFDSEAGRADLCLQSKGRKSGRFPGVIELEWRVEALPGHPVWIWTAVGDPAELEQFYRKLGLQIEKVIAKPDHAVPDLGEVKKLMEEARAAGALLAITEKDGVKFPPELRERCFILRRSVRLSPEVLRLFERLQAKPRAVN